MATRKKKQPDVIISAEVAESLDAKNTKIRIWPKIEKGSHLTIKTYEDGRTELEWDDLALSRDVKEAIDTFELGNKKPAVRAKAASRKKKDSVK